MTLYGKLLEREAANNPIKVGVIGAGQMGAGMIAQISTIPGMEVRGISDIQLESAKRAAEAYNDSSAKKVDIQVTTDFKEVIESDDVEIIVDATGVPEVGAKIALATLMTKKHLVLLNVEVDITIGPLMKKNVRCGREYGSPRYRALSLCQCGRTLCLPRHCQRSGGSGLFTG